MADLARRAGAARIVLNGSFTTHRIDRGGPVSLNNDQELANTRIKLARLEERHKALAAETGGDAELRDMTLESLKRAINQLKEEIVRYHATRSRSPNPAA